MAAKFPMDDKKPTSRFPRDEKMEDLNIDLRKIILGLETRGTKEEYREWKSNGLDFSTKSNLISKANAGLSRFSAQNDEDLKDVAIITDERTTNTIPTQVSPVRMQQSQSQTTPQKIVAMAPPSRECWTPQSSGRRYPDNQLIGSESSYKSKMSSDISGNSVTWPNMGFTGSQHRERPMTADSGRSDCESIASSDSNVSKQLNPNGDDRKSQKRKSCCFFLLGILTGALVVIILMATLAKTANDINLCSEGPLEPAALIGGMNLDGGTEVSREDEEVEPLSSNGIIESDTTRKRSTTVKTTFIPERTATTTKILDQNQNENPNNGTEGKHKDTDRQRPNSREATGITTIGPKITTIDFRDFVFGNSAGQTIPTEKIKSKIEQSGNIEYANSRNDMSKNNQDEDEGYGRLHPTKLTTPDTKIDDRPPTRKSTSKPVENSYGPSTTTVTQNTGTFATISQNDDDDELSVSPQTGDLSTAMGPIKDQPYTSSQNGDKVMTSPQNESISYTTMPQNESISYTTMPQNVDQYTTESKNQDNTTLKPNNDEQTTTNLINDGFGFSITPEIEDITTSVTTPQNKRPPTKAPQNQIGESTVESVTSEHRTTISSYEKPLESNISITPTQYRPTVTELSPSLSLWTTPQAGQQVIVSVPPPLTPLTRIPVINNNGPTTRTTTTTKESTISGKVQGNGQSHSGGSKSPRNASPPPSKENVDGGGGGGEVRVSSSGRKKKSSWWSRFVKKVKEFVKKINPF